MLKRYKIIVAYDGTDYCGWQVQKDKISVAQVLQDRFKSVFNVDVRVLGASRTDAGVHALGQVGMFDLAMNIDAQKLKHAWQNILPTTINIRALHEVDFQSNIYQNVINKTYWYHFFLARPLPLVARYGWYYRYPVDIEKLQQCLNVFIGTHDFRSFSTGDERGDDTIRTIHCATVEYISRYKMYRIEITGPKFLKYMIRRISGACIEVASRSDLAVDTIKKVLDAKNPEHLLPNAPAKGLLLYKIRYKEKNL